MVVCKYFQQGTCRYGQYCRFQHINNFGANQQGSGNKQFVEGKNIVLAVAEEVLAAERGGQWLLSCFGPLKEQPCIPGIDDVSPEEVRWEMYQAQKNGTVDQTKLQFQQLCQAMTAKREALKNPTHETAAMLEKLQKTNRDSTFGGKTNFALSTPQMAQAINVTSGSTVFAAQSFGSTGNPFGGGFNASSPSSSIFGRTPTNNTSVFGAKPSFGGTAVFGGQTNANPVFGGAASKTSAAVFGANQNNMQTFATTSSQSNSVFGGGATGQTGFAQPTTFGTTSQANGPFAMSQTVQSTTSVFGTATTATNSPFGAPKSTLFGGATNSTNIFGGSAAGQSGNSMFGSSTGTPTSTIGSTSIFVQPKSAAAFGGAPVFGTAGAFANNQVMFGAQPNFENNAVPANNVFGIASTQSTTFGANSQATNSFGVLNATAATPFGASVSTTSSSAPFGNQIGPFGSSGGLLFPRSSTFGGSMQSTNENFAGTAVNTSGSPFASANAGAAFGTISPPNTQPFGTPTFGNTPSTPFASTTSTTTTSNPFAPRSQQQINTPFGIAQTTMSSGGPFGQAKFGTITTPLIIDEMAYTMEGKLTDDEKSLYLSDQFMLGKIPVKPPTIELR